MFLLTKFSKIKGGSTAEEKNAVIDA